MDVRACCFARRNYFPETFHASFADMRERWDAIACSQPMQFDKFVFAALWRVTGHDADPDAAIAETFLNFDHDVRYPLGWSSLRPIRFGEIGHIGPGAARKRDAVEHLHPRQHPRDREAIVD